MTSPTQELPKRPFSGSNLKTSVPASKRLCKSTSTTSLTQTTGSPVRPLPSIQSIIELPEDEVWSLAKSDLRKYFFALQTYAQNPYALSATHASAEGSSKESSSEEDVLPLPKILSLPVEIRELIYIHLLPPAKDHPIRGPHPRQLQTHLHLTQPFPYAVLLVSRQIYNEALPIFYGAHSQTVYIKIDYNVWVHKTARSPLIISSALRAAIKHLHVTISLGCEKKNNKLGDVERDARLSEVVKGIKKARKWLAEADIHSLVIGWQEPPQTYTWEQKKEILEGLRPLRPKKVEAGEINWGLNWNKGRKYRFPIEHLKDLERSSNEYDRDGVR